MANIFTEKAGPLPVWAWMGIATVGVLGFAAIKGKSSSSSQNSTADQQQLAAEEAALANAAGSAATTGNNSAGTYGSGYGAYSGNGYSGGSSGVLSTSPAASTTTPVTTGSSSPAASTTTPVTTGSSSPAPTAGTTASTPAPVTTAPAPAKVSAGPISNLQASGVTSSGATVRWNPDSGNTQGYAWACTPTSGKGASKKGNTSGTSVTVSGLASKTTYNFGVQGLPGGAGNNIHFTTT